MHDAPQDLATESDGPEHALAAGATGEAPRAVRPEFGDPENWHDLAERGTPRNG